MPYHKLDIVRFVFQQIDRIRTIIGLNETSRLKEDYVRAIFREE